MRSPLIGGFSAGVTMVTASSWLTKFEGAMIVNTVIVLLIRGKLEESAFSNVLMLIIIIKNAAHVLCF